MKNLLFTFLFVATSLSETGAMPSREHQTDSQNQIPVSLYTVKHYPPVQVLIISSKEMVKFGEYITSEINLDCGSYNGHPVYSPIYIRYDMSLNEVVDSLCESFHVEGIECREGSITKEVFSKIFPSFSMNP